MKIFLKQFSGRTSTLDVEDSVPLSEVKAKIQEKEGTTTHLQSLVFNSKALHDERTLSDYNIREGSTLYLDNGLQVEITTARGDTIIANSQENETVMSLKERVCFLEGIPLEEQHLSFRGQPLDNRRTLGWYLRGEKKLRPVDARTRRGSRHRVDAHGRRIARVDTDRRVRAGSRRKKNDMWPSAQQSSLGIGGAVPAWRLRTKTAWPFQQGGSNP